MAVKELAELLGMRLVAYVAGVTETRAVRQWADAERVAHMLKSSAGTISATRLAELFRQAEAAAQSVDMQSVAMLGEKIDAEYGRVVAFLNHELGNSD